MAKFEFRERTIDLEIGDAKFQLVNDSDTGDKMVRIKDELIELLTGDKKLTRDEGVQHCVGIIDSLLGHGASEIIFHGRVMTYDDCVDVIWFIQQEVIENNRSRPGGEVRRAAMRAVGQL